MIAHNPTCQSTEQPSQKEPRARVQGSDHGQQNLSTTPQAPIPPEENPLNTRGPSLRQVIKSTLDVPLIKPGVKFLDFVDDLGFLVGQRVSFILSASFSASCATAVALDVVSLLRADFAAAGQLTLLAAITGGVAYGSWKLAQWFTKLRT